MRGILADGGAEMAEYWGFVGGGVGLGCGTWNGSCGGLGLRGGGRKIGVWEGVCGLGPGVV